VFMAHAVAAAVVPSPVDDMATTHFPPPHAAYLQYRPG